MGTYNNSKTWDRNCAYTCMGAAMLKFDTWALASLPQLKQTLVQDTCTVQYIVLTFIAAIIITLVH